MDSAPTEGPFCDSGPDRAYEEPAYTSVQPAHPVERAATSMTGESGARDTSVGKRAEHLVGEVADCLRDPRVPGLRRRVHSRRSPRRTDHEIS